MKYAIGVVILVLFILFIINNVKSVISTMRDRRLKKSSEEGKAPARVESDEVSEKEVDSK